MHKFKFIIAILISLATSMSGQDKISGLWYTIDDTDGKPKSHLELKIVNGKMVGTVVKLLPAASTTHCNKCKGDRKGKPIEGMQVVWDLEREDDKSYEDGEIIDPASGKIYSCNIQLVEEDKLKVRGYIGFSLLGRTQYWYRVK